MTTRHAPRLLLALAVACAAIPMHAALARSEPVTLPDPSAAMPAMKGDQIAVFAGGCFWGVEGVFEHVKGVKSATSGYAGGNKANAHYDIVSTGRTTQAESVRVVYDPAQVSYGQLLKIYFSVAHDPTELNRQSPDVGPQYRSEVFTTDAEQAKVAKAYIAQLDAAKVFPEPIVTKVEPLKAFYPAEDYHQNYMQHHPSEPYIVYNDAPKLVALKKLFPDLYSGS